MTPPAAPAEPKTGLGDFYRAHRAECLGAGGVLVAVIAYVRSKKSGTSSSSTSSSAIDPSTGYPAGSAEDTAALQAAATDSTIAATAPATTSTTTGDGSSTGYSGDGGGGGYGSEILTAIDGLQTTLTGMTLTDTAPPSTTSTPPSTTSPPPGITFTPLAPATPQPPTAAQTQNLTNLEAELKKDSAGSTAGDKASVVTLNKQIAAVKARS
jgi:hypothetical protein